MKQSDTVRILLTKESLDKLVRAYVPAIWVADSIQYHIYNTEQQMRRKCKDNSCLDQTLHFYDSFGDQYVLRAQWKLNNRGQLTEIHIGKRMDTKKLTRILDWMAYTVLRANYRRNIKELHLEPFIAKEAA